MAPAPAEIVVTSAGDQSGTDAKAREANGRVRRRSAWVFSETEDGDLFIRFGKATDLYQQVGRQVADGEYGPA